MYYNLNKWPSDHRYIVQDFIFSISRARQIGYSSTVSAYEPVAIGAAYASKEEIRGEDATLATLVLELELQRCIDACGKDKIPIICMGTDMCMRLPGSTEGA